MSQYLFDKLREDKSIEEVYYDEAGTWSILKSDKHPITKTRKQVLASEKDWQEKHAADDEPSVDVTEYLQGLEKENQELKEELQTLTDQVASLTKENEALQAAKK